MKNGLLDALSPEDQLLIRPFLKSVELSLKQTLYEVRQPIEFVYFFQSGLLSEVATANGLGKLEVGCIGREGLSGHAVLLGVETSPHFAFMQVTGTALRIPAEDLRRLMDHSATLRIVLLRFIHVFMVQIASSALSDGRFTIVQRLARWLLMCHDRVGNPMPLTHDFLALMLGVRRPGVTDTIHILEGEHLIKATRGCVEVRDRQGLIALAAGSYGLPEAEYRRLINPAYFPDAAEISTLSHLRNLAH